jgi:hypothetical protein
MVCNNNLNQNGFSKFYPKSILTRPYDFTSQFETAVGPVSRQGDCHDISLWQKQIGFNECAFASQIFYETFVNAISGCEK